MAKAKSKNVIAVIETKTVGINTIKTFDKNPRVGNVDAIVKSLKQFGQYRPILVNAKTNKILAGNHTYLAMRKMGEPEILVSFVDVDEATASAIVLADNKLSDMGTYDEETLGRLLADLDLTLIESTGYTASEVEELTGLITREAELAMERLDEAMTNGEDNDPLGKPPATPGEYDGDDESDMEPVGLEEENDFDSAQAELQGILELKEDLTFPIRNYWGIPVLRDDMLVQSFPDPIATWGGEEATPDDGVTNWIWVYGVAPSKNLPWERAFLSFFTYDTKFETWWAQPGYYTSKVINRGIKNAFVPDYSVWADDPRAIHLYNAFRGYWLGRYFQEAGIKVVPVAYHCDLESLKYMLPGIPKGSPTLCIQAQATTDAELREFKVDEGIRRIVGEVGPKELLIYAGNPGHNYVKELDLESQGIKVIYAMNYSGQRRGKVFDKQDGRLAKDRADRKSAKNESE